MAVGKEVATSSFDTSIDHDLHTVRILIWTLMVRASDALKNGTFSTNNEESNNLKAFYCR